MEFNNHWSLEGKHAFLSASQYSWLNYDEEKLKTYYLNKARVERGTKLHQLAADLITLGQRLPRTKETLNMHVNDALSLKMKPEVILYYSDICFGTADAISFDDHLLRVHDLKTGTHKAKFDQLRIYAALFCLEYRYDPFDIKYELRIYQDNNVRVDTPSPEEIQEIMNKIVYFNKIINDMMESEPI